VAEKNKFTVRSTNHIATDAGLIHVSDI
jgi:hypothetical protein